MTNPFYNPTGVPIAHTIGNSDAIRQEFAAIGTGLDSIQALKADLASPVFTGTPTVPTPTTGTMPATKAYVDATAFSVELPGQAGNAGKFVTTDGSSASWDDALPTQTGNAGKVLTTDGTDASWTWQRAWTRKTTTYTALSFDRIRASTTAAAWSLTFPAAPTDGDEIEVQDVDGTFDTNNLTILANGKKVMGYTTSWVMDTQYFHGVFVYDATLGDWRI